MIMRTRPLIVTVLGTLVSVAAVAQTSRPQGAPLPQGFPPVSSAPPAAAGSDTGARPGNDVGSGMSQPMGSRASNITPQDTRTRVAPNVPAPVLGDDATAKDYLRAAQAALSAGRTGQVQQALEMAQTRMLDRSVPYDQTNAASQNPAVAQISQALRALASGSRNECASYIEAALQSPG
jgi:hypothetical protein